MRVLNDREQRTETTEVGYLSLLMHVLMVSIGVATVIFAPLPMILSHVRLFEPWPKVAVIGGALVALVVLDVPVPVVVLTFAFGMYVSDAVTKKRYSIWRLVGGASLVALATAFFWLLTEASMERMNVVAYWASLVSQTTQQMKEVVQAGAAVEWNLIEALFFNEGPFFLIAGVVLSVWVSIGVCAHAGWLVEKNPFDSLALRKTVPSGVLSLAFVLSLIGVRFAVGYQHFFGGMLRILASLLFLEGTVVLSNWMARRQIRTTIRTAYYGFFVLIGFYALIGLGLFSPLFLKKKDKKKDLGDLSVLRTEEVI